jgi:hypothetical protein
MKIIIIILTFTGLTFNLNAQSDEYNIFFSEDKNSINRLTTDSSEINLETVNIVIQNIQFRTYKQKDNSFTYKGTIGIARNYYTAFSMYEYIAKKPLSFSFKGDKFTLEEGEKIYLLSITSNINEGKNSNKLFSKFLLSAYYQEMGINGPYRDRLVDFPIIDRKEFKRRNWINMGYGMNYLRKNHPFIKGKTAGVVFGYTLEALHFIPILGGPFFGETKKDKITIPLIGLASLLFWKSVVYNGFIGNNYIKQNEIFRQSNYKIPISIIE